MHLHGSGASVLIATDTLSSPLSTTAQHGLSNGERGAMQHVAEARTEIFNIIEARNTKVLAHFDEQYKGNQKTYSEAIDSAMVQLRSQMVTSTQSMVEEKVSQSSASTTELMKQCDQAQRVLLEENVKSIGERIDGNQQVYVAQTQAEGLAIRAEMQEGITTLQNNMARHMKERAAEIQQAIARLSDHIDARAARSHDIGSPPRGGSGNPGYYGDKSIHVKKEPMGSLSLKTSSGESPADFKNWRE